MRAKLSEWLPRVLFESALIVFSVLLALGLNEWNQQRQRDNRVAVALQGIRRELRANRQAMQDARDYHRSMLDSLRAYAAQGQNPPRRVYMRGMFKPAGVVSTAWESAREAGLAGDMPYDLVLTLSHAYGRQAEYDALGNRIVQDVYDDLRRRGVDAVLRDGYGGFMVLAEDFSNREGGLLEVYDRALEHLLAVTR